MSLLVDIQKRLGDFRLTARFETRGGVLGLLGASGCGKSMTLKCIAGVERPDRGTIVLDGETLFDSERGIDLPPQKRRVGYLFQNHALFPNMTVRQNILCGLRGEKNRARREAELEKALRLCRLEGLEDRRPHQLSGGSSSGPLWPAFWSAVPGYCCWTSPSPPWTATCGRGSSWSCGSCWASLAGTQ